MTYLKDILLHRMAFSRWLWLYALCMVGFTALGFILIWLADGEYSYLAVSVFVCIVICICFFTYSTVRYMAGIVQRIEKFADSVAGGNLQTPLPRTRDHGEIGQILKSLDSMQAQLQNSFDALRAEQSQNALLVQAINQSSNSVMVTDTHARILYVNDAFVEQTGYSRNEAVGQTPKLIQSGKTPARVYQTMRQLLQQGESWQGELINRRKDGSEFIETVNISPVRDKAGNVYRFMAVKQDITDIRRAQDSIERLAYFDPLTDLPNRRYFLDQLNRKINLSKREQKSFALLFIDLNRFKEINDAQGHIVGDQVLSEVARRFAAQTQVEHVLARLGGDEFVMLTDDISPRQLLALAERLLNSIRTDFYLEGSQFDMNASVGVAFYPDHGVNSTDLLRRADIAMYHAKASTDDIKIYQSYMSEKLEQRVVMAGRLQQALAYGEGLSLAIQPQVNMLDGSLSGAEVLLRWQDELLGQVSPGEFIPLAEERGLIDRLDKYVIEQSCAALAGMQKTGTPLPVPLSVNVSMAFFETTGFADWLAECMGRYGIKAEVLELEITESGLMHSRKRAVKTAESLHVRGVCLAIDDFGTGYSSLAYLKQFNPGKVKIDQSFIRDLVTSEASQAIVRATISMVSELGMQVLAEGVEGQAEADILQHSGCDLAQGYFYARPMPLKEFTSQVPQNVVVT